MTTKVKTIVAAVAIVLVAAVVTGIENIGFEGYTNEVGAAAAASN